MEQTCPSSFTLDTLPLPLTTSHQSSWVDEFLDFSATRRSHHRRLAYDATDFDEAPYAEECRDSSNDRKILMAYNIGEFQRLDGGNFRGFFSEEAEAEAAAGSTRSSSNPSSSYPSTPSDQNSENDEKTSPALDDPQQHANYVEPKNEAGEKMESSCKPHMQMQMENLIKPPTETIVDPKRIKRILANRQSAQRSRVRKLQYVSELERSLTTLQNEVSALSPKVAYLDQQRLLLNIDNCALKQRIAALAQDKIFKDAHQEALRKEIERLRQIYYEQNVKKILGNNEASKIEALNPPPPAPLPAVKSAAFT